MKDISSELELIELELYLLDQQAELSADDLKRYADLQMERDILVSIKEEK